MRNLLLIVAAYLAVVGAKAIGIITLSWWIVTAPALFVIGVTGLAALLTLFVLSLMGRWMDQADQRDYS